MNGSGLSPEFAVNLVSNVYMIKDDFICWDYLQWALHFLA